MAKKVTTNLDLRGDLLISGAANTYSGRVLTSNGDGTLQWAPVSGGGGGSLGWLGTTQTTASSGGTTSLTGMSTITGVTTSGTGTVTGTTFTISPGTAATTSTAGDYVYGATLVIKGGIADASGGSSTGYVYGGDVNIDGGAFNGSASSGFLQTGKVNIGTIATSSTNIDANLYNAEGGNYSGTLNLGAVYASIVNIGTSSNTTYTNIHSGGTTRNGSYLNLGSNLPGSTAYTHILSLGNNNGVSTQIRMGTNTISASDTLLFGKTLFQQPSPPTTISTARTLTTTDLLTFIVVSSATSGSFNLPTGTNMDTNIHSSFTNVALDWSFINTGGSGSVAFVAATGHTYVGNLTISANTSARLRSRRTNTNTWITYRLS
jgi:hypothetical protein